MSHLFKIYSLLLALTSAVAFATPGYHYVDAVYTKGERPGVAMKMIIKDQRAIEHLREVFPYDDCYQGACTYSEVGVYRHLIINFTHKTTERAIAIGKNATYLLTITQSGPNLLIKNNDKYVSWQFRP